MRRTTTYHCSGPNCPNHQESPVPVDTAPITGWLVLTSRVRSSMHQTHDFCSTDCVMRWAAQFDAPEEI